MTIAEREPRHIVEWHNTRLRICAIIQNDEPRYRVLVQKETAEGNDGLFSLSPDELPGLYYAILRDGHLSVPLVKNAAEYPKLCSK